MKKIRQLLTDERVVRPVESQLGHTARDCFAPVVSVVRQFVETEWGNGGLWKMLQEPK